MGQSELIDLLNRKKDWMLAREIKNDMKLAAGAINRLIKICYENGEIDRKPAIEIIKDKKRLRVSTIKANAYKLKR